MRRSLSIIALTLSSLCAAPAFADEPPLLLVVSDFDAAVLKDALATSMDESNGAQMGQFEAQKNLDKILGELRKPRQGLPLPAAEVADAPQPAAQQPLISSTNQARRRSPNPV